MLNVRSVFLDDGGHLLTYTDKTERRKLEAQLRQAQKMEAVGTLAGGIAHDFNNLLQAILGYSDLLLLRTSKEHPSYREIQQIFRSARRGADLVKQLLTFSRGIESKPRSMDLNQTVTEVRKLLGRTLPKMIAIELCLDENLKSIDADPAQMEQVLMNLAVNARDAMPNGGKLTIRTENVTLDATYGRTHLGTPHGDHILLTVADTGHGMDRQTLEHAFEPFYTTKEVGKGTGLGLSMVYGIVEEHGGHIKCTSEPGKGAAFEIYLPASEFQEKRREECAAGESPGGVETVLLIDDEEPIREFATDMLSRFGYRVITAEGGERGIEVYEEMWSTIDVVVLDLIMPGLSGKDCHRELLAINPDVRVVFASGHHMDDEMKLSLAGPAAGFISKPYDMQTMLTTIRKALS
jgi:nitrogen-specific signal transduction histidine kinase/CheY-like chemotaxis protein